MIRLAREPLPEPAREPRFIPTMSTIEDPEDLDELLRQREAILPAADLLHVPSVPFPVRSALGRVTGRLSWD